MARIPIVAGNWKMNTVAESARDLIEAMKAGGIDSIQGVEKVICPPFVYLGLAADLTRGTSLRVGAQDVHWEEKGAFTGEVSPAMLRDYAVYAIIGHSERRALFGETDEQVSKKLKAALDHRLMPIVCVGETGSEREAGQTLSILRRQVHGALHDVELPATAVIAYEPVWAIGTGVAATAADANDAIGFIRDEVSKLQGTATAEAIRILYGGSVNATNITDFFSQPEVDGGLAGGASLDAAAYVAMCRSVAEL
ncbi:MAG: triose-phosphate isomerase [Dehalococcoidia bacterium]|nr:triose-phosphate isomerase [Dehalococcoidia bacterium]